MNYQYRVRCTDEDCGYNSMPEYREEDCSPGSKFHHLVTERRELGVWQTRLGNDWFHITGGG